MRSGFRGNDGRRSVQFFVKILDTRPPLLYNYYLEAYFYERNY